MSTNQYESINENYLKYNKKHLRHENNKEFVTARAHISNNKSVIRMSIGLLVAELVGFKEGDRVHVLCNKHDRNLLLFNKSFFPNDGYKLFFRGPGGSFLTFGFTYETSDSFRLSQTTLLDFDITKGKLLVNIAKLKWNN